MLNITEYSQRSMQLKAKVQKMLSQAGMEFNIQDDSISPIRLVFAGQYSAGKSSILKMLTGRTDIAIGAGITTQQARTYNWKGLEVIDTPGIHTELRPDHDEISYEAIVSADMLVFVVTNELFDAFIAEHFRKLAIDKDKAGEMILVVNKMERAADGNSVAQRDIIREDLQKVLVPYTPEQLNLSFLDAESYLDGIAEQENDAELAEELIERSGYIEFIETLNRFVVARRLPSKLTTGLYMIDEQLEKAIRDLRPKSSDSDIDALEESFIQQRHVLIEARGRMRQEIEDIYTSTASRIRDIGLDAANLIIDGCKRDEVEDELNRAIDQVNDLIEKSQAEALDVIEARFNEIGERLEILKNSEFSQNLKLRLSGKFDGLPEEIQRILTNAGSGFQEVGHKVLKNAYNADAQGGLELTNFSGSTIHRMVSRFGRSIGYKLKSWQALKITRVIAIGGQVLNVLGIGLTVFMQIKTDQDEQKIQESLKSNRQNIRSQFNMLAKEFEDFARQYIRDNVIQQLELSISAMDRNIQEIRDSRRNRSLLCRNIEELQQECRLLIRDIHSTNLEQEER